MKTMRSFIWIWLVVLSSACGDLNNAKPIEKTEQSLETQRQQDTDVESTEGASEGVLEEQYGDEGYYSLQCVTEKISAEDCNNGSVSSGYLYSFSLNISRESDEMYIEEFIDYEFFDGTLYSPVARVTEGMQGIQGTHVLEGEIGDRIYLGPYNFEGRLSGELHRVEDSLNWNGDIYYGFDGGCTISMNTQCTYAADTDGNQLEDSDIGATPDEQYLACRTAESSNEPLWSGTQYGEFKVEFIPADFAEEPAGYTNARIFDSVLISTHETDDIDPYVGFFDEDNILYVGPDYWKYEEDELHLFSMDPTNAHIRHSILLYKDPDARQWRGTIDYRSTGDDLVEVVCDDGYADGEEHNSDEDEDSGTPDRLFCRSSYSYNRPATYGLQRSFFELFLEEDDEDGYSIARIENSVLEIEISSIENQEGFLDGEQRLYGTADDIWGGQFMTIGISNDNGNFSFYFEESDDFWFGTLAYGSTGWDVVAIICDPNDFPLGDESVNDDADEEIEEVRLTCDTEVRPNDNTCYPWRYSDGISYTYELVFTGDSRDGSRLMRIDGFTEVEWYGDGYSMTRAVPDMDGPYHFFDAFSPTDALQGGISEHIYLGPYSSDEYSGELFWRDCVDYDGSSCAGWFGEVEYYLPEGTASHGCGAAVATTCRFKEDALEDPIVDDV